MNTESLLFHIKTFKNEEDYNKIIIPIKKYYENQKDFKLLLETKELIPEQINIQSLYNLSIFLNSLKKYKYQYLKKTTIKIYNEYCYNLLYFLFTYLSSPVAEVEVILYNSSHIDKIKSFFP